MLYTIYLWHEMQQIKFFCFLTSCRWRAFPPSFCIDFHIYVEYCEKGLVGFVFVGIAWTTKVWTIWMPITSYIPRQHTGGAAWRVFSGSRLIWSALCLLIDWKLVLNSSVVFSQMSEKAEHKRKSQWKQWLFPRLAEPNVSESGPLLIIKPFLSSSPAVYNILLWKVGTGGAQLETRHNRIPGPQTF